MSVNKKSYQMEPDFWPYPTMLTVRVKGEKYNKSLVIIQSIIFSLSKFIDYLFQSLGHVLCAREMKVERHGPNPHGTVL